MCGIFFTLSETSAELGEDEVLLDRISRRGPDSLRTCRVVWHNLTLRFTSSVLHLRGEETVQQPVRVGQNVLCWNGEAWSGLDLSLSENDTAALSNALSKNEDAIARVFEQIRGPYAFVYYQAARGKVWYGRDILGRRSLLTNKLDTGFTLCSVGHRQNSWSEVDVKGIHCYDLCTKTTTTWPWAENPSRVHDLQKSYTRVNDLGVPASLDTKDRSTHAYKHAVSCLQAVLTDSLRIKTETLPSQVEITSEASRIAVMYSGGVDCAVIARLLHDILPNDEPIDLLNVSFENPRTLNNARKLDSTFNKTYETPDRVTGLQGYDELRRSCPAREWRFVAIDVPYREAISAKDDVLELMHPNDSIMDFSIALAFYFCARGQGTLFTTGIPYHCTAKVFFSGLGADEQLGGYSRHLAAWTRGGHNELIKELQCDLDRIPSRNLGRDDRILAHFGREVRWPFLDENVISFLSQLRLDTKMTFQLGPGQGDKVILRDLARQLDIPRAAGEKKRAIQFGSRSARMEIENGKSDKVKGHNKQS
ncbi:protein of unknown function [Taphrina deformans PYCC 5710]|uniref:Asparagine synthetase domain-containing protein n=1 Tax=Taphrina deformans (strain PYCC 5710 / ATCC 11124 / CBS 356.35 / IMI 108563 / JCM 9778 / NBRC 8474) TaxID=1097556 RepID=R4XLI0_TAPDE|nr:protein of unknown function [Taphrina deformans PYCC 5710]|eukprot:CCG84140.1 protein of unknown function [Taphrina deformans PYCC 5710]